MAAGAVEPDCSAAWWLDADAMLSVPAGCMSRQFPDPSARSTQAIPARAEPFLPRGSPARAPGGQLTPCLRRPRREARLRCRARANWLHFSHQIWTGGERLHQLHDPPSKPVLPLVGHAIVGERSTTSSGRAQNNKTRPLSKISVEFSTKRKIAVQFCKISDESTAIWRFFRLRFGVRFV
eukprot:scaffold702_cov119-Isochrysis_galbana.AAC.6